jgi:hypothetical protein
VAPVTALTISGEGFPLHGMPMVRGDLFVIITVECAAGLRGRPAPTMLLGDAERPGSAARLRLENAAAAGRSRDGAEGGGLSVEAFWRRVHAQDATDQELALEARARAAAAIQLAWQRWRR